MNLPAELNAQVVMKCTGKIYPRLKLRHVQYLSCQNSDSNSYILAFSAEFQVKSGSTCTGLFWYTASADAAVKICINRLENEAKISGVKTPTQEYTTEKSNV